MTFKLRSEKLASKGYLYLGTGAVQADQFVRRYIPDTGPKYSDDLKISQGKKPNVKLDISI